MDAILHHHPFSSLKNAVTNPDGDKSVADMIEEAEAGYNVHKGEVFVKVGENDDGTPKLVSAPNTAMLYRDSDDVVVSPNSVTLSQYGVLDMNYMGEIMQHFVDEGWVTPESCFLLEDSYGRPSREFLVGRITDPKLLEVPGDKSPYIRHLILGNPQGHGSIFLQGLAYRFFCTNQLRGAGSILCMPHKKNVADRFSDANRRFFEVRAEMIAHNAFMGILNETPFDVAKATDAVLKIRPGADLEKDISGQKRNQRERIIANAHNTRIGCYGRTLGDVYQGLTHETTHHDGGKGSKTPEKRFLSVTEGTKGKLETAGLNTLLGLAGIDNPKTWVRENVTV